MNKKPVATDNEDVKGDKRYEYHVEKTIPHPKYMENQVRPSQKTWITRKR